MSSFSNHMDPAGKGKAMLHHATQVVAFVLNPIMYSGWVCLLSIYQQPNALIFISVHDVLAHSSANNSQVAENVSILLTLLLHVTHVTALCLVMVYSVH